MNATKESPYAHRANRKTAVIVGILFIIGTVSGVLSGIVTAPIRRHPGGREQHYLDWA